MKKKKKDILETAVEKAFQHPHILPTKFLNMRNVWLPPDF